MGLTDTLIEFAASTPPEPAREMMRLSALDWATCGISGARDGSFAQFASINRGVGPCALIGGGMGDPAAAALINGTLSHALDFDDTHFAHIGHPSVAVMPAAVAMGELVQAPLSTIIDAALVGAEASVAVGIWLGRRHYETGFHQTATAGAFGATLAVARLLELDENAVRHALGLASTMASGLKSQFGTMGKPLNAGLAARTGVEAGMWARADVTSCVDGLNGALGFGPTHHGEDISVDLPVEPWRMTRVSHKLHACCHGLHAALNAVAPIDLSQAAKIRVRTNPRWMSVCNIEKPETGLAAKFSYKQVVAMAALGITTRNIASFSDENVLRPDICAFRERVDVEADADLGEWQAVVEVDGASYHHDLETPCEPDVLTSLLRQKARSLVGDRADLLWNAIQSDDRAAFIRLLA